MPTVPTISAPQVRTDGIPNARLTAVPSTNSPVGDALGNAGHAMVQVYSDQRRKAQATMYADSLTQLKQATLTQEYDPSSGWRQKKGADSFGLHDTVLPEWDKSADQIAENIPDEEVRARFKQHAADQRADVNQRLDGWVADQHGQYEAQVLDNGIKTSQQAAALNWQDPARVQREVADQAERLRSYQQSNGLPADWAEARIQAAASETHGSVIDQMLTAGNDAAAKRYLDEHKGEMSADALVHYGKAVDYGNTQTEAQAATARIYQPDKSLEQMEAEADKITDQRVQASAKQRLREMTIAHHQAVDEQGANLLKDGLRIINSDPRGWDAIPPQTLTALNDVDPIRYEALKQRAAQLIRHEDITTPEGNAAWIRARSALSGAMGESARSAALNEDWNKIDGQLSRADSRELHDLVDKAKTGKDLTSEHTEEEIAATTLALNGYAPHSLNANGTPNLEAIAFRNAMRKQLAASKDAGKKLSPEDIQRTANRLMAPVATGAHWYGGDITVPTFMLGVDRSVPATAVGGGTATGAYALTAADFSEEQLQATKATLRGSGLATDDQSVLRYLRAKAAGGAVRPGAAPGVPYSAPGPDSYIPDGSFGN